MKTENQEEESKRILPEKLHFILLLIFGIVVIFESVYLISVLTKTRNTSSEVKNPPPPLVVPTPPLRNKGKMGIVLEDNETVVAGENLKAKIVFDSPDEPVGGIDLIVDFDPRLVSIIDFSNNNDIFRQIIINTQKRKGGEIKITAYQPTKILKGENILASLTFKLLENKPTVIKIRFLGPEVVTDSNLISQSTQKDILESVEDLIITPKNEN